MRAVVLDGIVIGLAFGLLGVGMTLVYGLGGVINLAYGQIVVVGDIAASLVIEDGHSQTVAAVVGVLAAVGVSLLLDLTLLRAVYRQHGEERILLGLLLTLGAAFVIVGLLTARYPTGALFISITGEPVSMSRKLLSPSSSSRITASTSDGSTHPSFSRPRMFNRTYPL